MNQGRSVERRKRPRMRKNMSSHKEIVDVRRTVRLARVHIIALEKEADPRELIRIQME